VDLPQVWMPPRENFVFLQCPIRYCLALYAKDARSILYRCTRSMRQELKHSLQAYGLVFQDD
jgi:hypothetical protein